VPVESDSGTEYTPDNEDARSIGGFTLVGVPPAPPDGFILVFRVLPTPGWYPEPGGGGGGGGDMYKSVYDADNDTVVDKANAVRILGINLPAGPPTDGQGIRYNSGAGAWELIQMPSDGTYAGNPNNFVDGKPGDMVRDTVNNLLWYKTSFRGNLSGWIIT